MKMHLAVNLILGLRPAIQLDWHHDRSDPDASEMAWFRSWELDFGPFHVGVVVFRQVCQ